MPRQHVENTKEFWSENEAKRANANKRIIYWSPFLNKVYTCTNKVTIPFQYETNKVSWHIETHFSKCSVQFVSFYSSWPVLIISIECSFPLVYVMPKLLKLMKINCARLVAIKNTCENNNYCWKASKTIPCFIVWQEMLHLLNTC